MSERCCTGSKEVVCCVVVCPIFRTKTNKRERESVCVLNDEYFEIRERTAPCKSSSNSASYIIADVDSAVNPCCWPAFSVAV